MATTFSNYQSSSYTDVTSGGGFGGDSYVPDASQYQQGDASQYQQGGDLREMRAAWTDASAAFKELNSAQHDLQKMKRSKKFSFKNFFRAVLGLEQAAHKMEKAGEEFVGQNGQGN
jgi:hypothetical protein